MGPTAADRSEQPGVIGLTAGVVRWDDGGTATLWHRATGRHVRLPIAVLAAPSPPVRARLVAEGMLADGPALDLAALVVARSRLVLLLAEVPALWAPVPGFRTAGGYGYREIALSPQEVAAWRAINDSRNAAGIAEAAGMSMQATLAFLGRLTGPDVQAVQLRARRPHPRDPGLERLVSPPRPDAPRTPDQRGTGGETTLTAYHLHGITDGATHFDDRETTVAHALAEPHPALAGRRYGRALRDALSDRDMLPEAGWTVEIGCGTGHMAAAFGLVPYLRVDLSPELLRTQAVHAPGTRAVLADGTALPLRDGSAALVLSNEVAADLTAVPWAPGDGGPVGERVARYGLPAHPGRAMYNLGAWRLVEAAARVLRPGGWLYLSEFGSLDGAAQEAVQLDHPEVSIQFSHLRSVAEGNGLDAEVIGLADLLGMDLHARQLSRISHHALRARARMEGWHLPARAWSEAALAEALPWPVEGLHWVPMTDEGPGPLVTRFLALVARKR